MTRALIFSIAMTCLAPGLAFAEDGSAGAPVVEAEAGASAPSAAAAWDPRGV